MSYYSFDSLDFSLVRDSQLETGRTIDCALFDSLVKISGSDEGHRMCYLNLNKLDAMTVYTRHTFRKRSMAKKKELMLIAKLPVDMFDKLVLVVENWGVESGDGECDIIAETLKAQKDVQLGNISTERVNATCFDCQSKLYLPKELCAGKGWKEGSSQYYCPFCDFKCEKYRCPDCHRKHLTEETTCLPS